MIGPVVKIDPATLPRRPNIHYLGMKPYDELPAYLAGWDVALLPFARNEATRFISPTKTPEYLAAGRPVVSTSIRDVVRPYGEQGLVRDRRRRPRRSSPRPSARWPARRGGARARDGCAGSTTSSRACSWDRTWRQMSDLIGGAVLAAPRPARRDARQTSQPVARMPARAHPD